MTAMTLEQFSERICEIMPRIAKGFFRHQAREFYKTKITLPQFVVMDILYSGGEAKMTDLAGSINVTTAAMTGLADRLVRDGYVKRIRDSKDRRIVRIGLTAKGSRVVKKMIDSRKRMIMKMFSLVSQSEREEYLRILTNIYNNLK